MALTEPLSDCSTLLARIGSVKKNSVRAIGPSVSAARGERTEAFMVCARSLRGDDGRLRAALHGAQEQHERDHGHEACHDEPERLQQAEHLRLLRDLLGEQ